MTFSIPQLIQFAIKCHLCQKDPKISYKCLECDLLMCSECEHNIHPKIKTAGVHRIMAINDVGSTPPPNKDIGNTSSSNKDYANVDMPIVGEYQTKLEGVFHLTLSLDNLLWIGDGYHKKKIRVFSSHKGLQKVKCEGDRLQLISSFNNQIYNLAINSGNDLLLATDGPILKQIKNGTHEVVNTVYDLHLYQPISIYVTRNNKVVVGASNSHNQVVIVMDNKGNPEKVYGNDQNKYISFACPCRITVTSNDNIFVIDRTGMNMEEG